MSLFRRVRIDRIALRVVSLAMVLAASPGAGAAGPPGVAARVNGVDVREELVRQALEAEKAERLATGRPEPQPAELEVLRRRTIDRLVATELIHQAVLARKEVPEPMAVAIEVDKVRARFEDEDSLRKSLAKEGLTPATLPEALAREIGVERWLEREVEPKVVATDAAVKAYYEQHRKDFLRPETARARHIVALTARNAKPADRTAARGRAEQALTRVKAGEDFAAVAREISEETATAAQGGDLGEILRGQTLPDFEPVLFRLNPGEVSGVVETDLGFHVIQVTERRPPEPLPFEQVQDEVRELVRTEVRRLKLEEVLKDLRKAARIEVF